MSREDPAPAAPEDSETLEDFKNSFAYGSRADLTFKFLKQLGPAQAGEAIRQILHAVGDTFDSGDIAELHDLIIGWQVTAYTPPDDAPSTYVYDDAPFTPLQKPLSESRVALLTSSGHFADGDDPEPFGVKDMTQEEAAKRISEFLKEAPQLSMIPRDVDVRDLRVRHGGYDIRSAQRDANVTFPRDALVAAEHAGRIGELVDPSFSFPGAASQGRLRKRALPGWLELFTASKIDVMLLVPV